MAQPQRTRGLVLRHLPYSDSSQIVWVFARDEGLMSLLAKGAYRLPRRSSSFQAPFDVTGWYDIVYRRRRGDLQLATEARLIEGFGHLRRDLPAYLDACFAVEAVLRIFQPADPHPRFLRGLLSYLKLLGIGRGRTALRVHLVSHLLEAGGFGPRWNICLECGKVLEPAQPRRLRLPSGVVCRDCASASDEPLEPAIGAYLAEEGSIPWGRVPNLEPAAGVLGGVWQLQKRLLLHQLEKPLKTVVHLRT